LRSRSPPRPRHSEASADGSSWRGDPKTWASGSAPGEERRHQGVERTGPFELREMPRAGNLLDVQMRNRALEGLARVFERDELVLGTPDDPRGPPETTEAVERF